ncbi:FtsQ-type POTRA domain-containing protein [Curtobacterium sp. 22159]|uniref:FtsQ-type POTRA domain-containing protein n=1 Tax=Curtobacterium sp. 22159 TaxID=3453882 RepID=UPI003F84EDF1
MKRPEGFDERPAQPDATAEDAPAPRQRRGPRLPQRSTRRTSDGLEARSEPVSSARDDDALPSTAAAHPATDVAPPHDGVRRPQEGANASQRERTGALARAAGRRLGAGWSTVADRLREYTPDEDHPGSRTRSDAPTDADHDDLYGPDPDVTVTDVLEPHRASRGGLGDTDTHTTPIGAGVRAAETAREARVAKRRRRLLERAEVRRFTRRSRHRRAAWITAAGIVVVFGVSILVAVFSPLMALQTIEIKGTNRVDETQLRQALSDQIGTPLARLDFGAIKRDIAGFPLIESYVTEEAPPHTLVVTVTERTPVVAVRSGSSFDLVDPAGIVVQSSPKQPANMPLADIGRTKLGSPVFRTMTEVVLALPSTVRAQVTSVAASTSDDVTLTLKDGSSVVWGNPEQSDAKAALLASLVKDHAARNPGAVVEYDVSAPDNGIIRAKS